jgi:hypothetical protein
VPPPWRRPEVYASTPSADCCTWARADAKLFVTRTPASPGRPSSAIPHLHDHLLGRDVKNQRRASRSSIARRRVATLLATWMNAWSADRLPRDATSTATMFNARSRSRSSTSCSSVASFRRKALSAEPSRCRVACAENCPSEPSQRDLAVLLDVPLNTFSNVGQRPAPIAGANARAGSDGS